MCGVFAANMACVGKETRAVQCSRKPKGGATSVWETPAQLPGAHSVLAERAATQQSSCTSTLYIYHTLNDNIEQACQL